MTFLLMKRCHETVPLQLKGGVMAYEVNSFLLKSTREEESSLGFGENPVSDLAVGNHLEIRSSVDTDRGRWFQRLKDPRKSKSRTLAWYDFLHFSLGLCFDLYEHMRSLVVLGK